jgi:hypothetical protein
MQSFSLDSTCLVMCHVAIVVPFEVSIAVG